MAAQRAVPAGWAVLAVVFVTTVLISLNGTMLSIALPAVVDDLDASATEATWILLGYMLVNTSLMVPMGQVADSVDRRRMFLAGLVLYTGAALGLGLAPSAELFLAARAIQGLAAAMLLANTAAIIAAVFPPQLMNRAMGIYLSGFSIAQVAGPSVGGLITAWAGWRWLFWATVPIGLLALGAGWRVLRGIPRRPAAGRGDVLGSLVLFVALTGLLFALSSASQRGWSDPVVIGGFTAFVTLVPVLAVVSRRARRPAIDVTLFRSRDFTLSLTAGFLLAMPRMSVMVVAALYFQGLEGDTALEAALKVTPFAVALTVGSLLADVLTRWVEERLLVVLGAAGSLVGMAVVVLAVIAGDRAGWLIVGLTVIGLGTGLLHPITSSIVMRSAPPGAAGSVNALRVTAQSGGTTLSTAVGLSLVVSGASPHTAQLFFSGQAGALDAAQFAELTGGYVLAFAVLGGMLLLGLVAGIALLRSRRRPPRSVGAAPSVAAVAPPGPA